jgi:hypothetical protein
MKDSQLAALLQRGKEYLMVEKLFTVTDSLGSYLVKVLIEEIKTQRTMWAVTPQQQQQEAIDRIADHVDLAVKNGVKRLLAAGLPSITAQLDQITIKDGVKATLTFGQEELHALADLVGSKIVLVLADPDTHAAGVHSYTADADQQPLGI